MDEVQDEDGEEVAGGAVGRRSSHLRGSSRRGCSDLGRSRAAAGEERAARASVGVEEEAKGERALRGGEGVVPVRSRGGRALAVVGAFIFDADDAGGDPVSRSVTARTPSATSGTLISRETRRPDVRCALTDGVAEASRP